MQQVKIVLLFPPGCAHAVVAQFCRLYSCVPTLKNRVELGRLVANFVRSEPGQFDHAATERSRFLLILTREVVLALNATDVTQNFQRLALGMQSFARTSPYRASIVEGLDDVRFLLDCDGWESKDFPMSLLQYVPHEIVLM